MEGLYVVGGVLLLALLVVVGMYNSLIKIRNQCREAWSGIETELQRRYDLIPNLVETVKGYARHERQVLEEVTQLRNVCSLNHGSPEQQAKSENSLVRSLGRLLAVVENYPELKADRHFLDLQEELVITEDRIQAARRFYNGNVREMNVKVESFPSNLLASAFGFEREEFFAIEDLSVAQPPNLDLQSLQGQQQQQQ
jgi:LemA protein